MYATIIVALFVGAFAFAFLKFTKWALSHCNPDGMVHGQMAHTVWRLRDVSTAMLMMPEKDLFRKAGGLLDNDVQVLQNATNTMINVLFGQQASNHKRQQRLIVGGGGFRVWNHNEQVVQMIKDTESGKLHDAVAQSCRFRLRLLKLARAATMNPLDERNSSDEYVARPQTSGGSSSNIATGSSSTNVSRVKSTKDKLREKAACCSCFVDSGIRRLVNHAHGVADMLELSYSQAITRKEFGDVIKTKFKDLDMPEEDLDLIFCAMDTDGGGTITMRELTMFMMALAPEDLVTAHMRSDAETEALARERDEEVDESDRELARLTRQWTGGQVGRPRSRSSGRTPSSTGSSSSSPRGLRPASASSRSLDGQAARASSRGNAIPRGGELRTREEAAV